MYEVGKLCNVERKVFISKQSKEKLKNALQAKKRTGITMVIRILKKAAVQMMGVAIKKSL